MKEFQELFRTRLRLDVEKVGVELISISNLPWYCIGPQLEFYCLDEYALPFGIFVTNPFPFSVWMPEGIKIEFYLRTCTHPHPLRGSISSTPRSVA
jgi:hypothetical protein